MPESFLIQLQASAYNFIKKETVAQVFSCEFSKIFKGTFMIKHLPATASGRIQLLRLQFPSKCERMPRNESNDVMSMRTLTL